MSAIRLVLADDQALIRSGVALVLSTQSDIDVVAECSNGSELLRAVARHQPDLVLTDVRMPGVDGIEASQSIREQGHSPPILALTTFDDDDVLWPVLAAGVNGFVLKDSAAESLIEAVRAVAAGGSWLDPRVLPRVLERAAGQPVTSTPDAQALADLTPRERQVLDLICVGASNQEISASLRTSERTVKSQVSAILQKLGARDRAAVIVIAYESGWRRS